MPEKKGDRLKGRVWRYEHLYTPEIEKYWNEWLNIKDGSCMFKKLTVGDESKSDVYETFQTIDRISLLFEKCKIKVS